MPAVPPYVTPGAPVTGEWGNLVVDNLTDFNARLIAMTLLGEMKIWPGDTEPPNFMFCRGQAISRATYSNLFSVVGTKFGIGDGSTTFNLPNMQGMVPVGLNTGTADGIVGSSFTGAVGNKLGTTTAILPLHSHPGGSHTHPVNIWSGNIDRYHQHYVSANTSDVSILHRHGLNQIGEYYRYNPFAPAYRMRVNDGTSQLPLDIPNANALVSEPEGYHVHNFSAWSGNENQGHLHPVNGNTDAAVAGTTGAVGSSAVNGNVQPSMIVNYIIKVTNT